MQGFSSIILHSSPLLKGLEKCTFVSRFHKGAKSTVFDFVSTFLTVIFHIVLCLLPSSSCTESSNHKYSHDTVCCLSIQGANRILKSFEKSSDFVGFKHGHTQVLSDVAY